MTVKTETVKRDATQFDLFTRTVNTDTRVEYTLGDLTLTITRDNAKVDLWNASFNCLASKNRKDVPVQTQGYDSEKAQPYDKCAEHMMLSLSRQMLKIAGLRDSDEAPKGKQTLDAALNENATLKSEKNAVVAANSRVAAIIAGTDTTSLTDAERALIEPILAGLADAKLAEKAS